MINMTKEELMVLKSDLEKQYEEVKAKNISMDMSRGKPGADQLEITMDMMDTLTSKDIIKAENGTDCRNYGVLDGIPEAKKLMADIMGVKAENVIVFGNASLTIMFDAISRAYTHGVVGSTPWCRLDKVKWLCPVPGYDRHFAITERFGFEMINIEMKDDGPDMDMVEKLVAEDESIKGIWCVPKYSNPGGIVYSEEVVKRMAALKPAAKDFRIFWDNAYCIHHLYPENKIEIPDILEECEKAGNPDMVYEFASTSKVTFPGSGISAFAASKANLEDVKKHMTIQTIGYDKINQLRHVKYFKDINGVHAHMAKHAAIIRPKFEMVLDVLEKELGGKGIAKWTKPMGGYFIALETPEGTAGKIVKMCKDAGLVLTPAGSTHPLKKDPKDNMIRIAPTFPTVAELKEAAEVLTLCVKIASAEKLIEK